MPFTEDEAVRLIGRAATLYERRDTTQYQPINSALGGKRVGWWKKALGNNEAAFQKRLAWDNWQAHEASGCLDDQVWIGSPLPAWFVIVRDSMAQLHADDHVDDTLACSVPFAHVLVPLAGMVWWRFDGALDSAETRLLPSAKAHFRHNLVTQLANICTSTLFEEFGRFKPEPQHKGARYNAFVQRLLNGGLKPIMLRYPYLMRLIGTCMLSWQAHRVEFVERLNTDWPQLQARLGVGDFVSELAFDLSDPHNVQRTATMVLDERGTRFIYKPKPLRVDTAYLSLLNWFENNGFLLGFKGWEVVEGDGYGWVEYLQAKPCSTAEEVTTYFHRAGGLLCIWDFLGGNDGHFQNLISVGDQPVIFDIETLLAPRPKQLGQLANSSNYNLFQKSVVATGLLPSYPKNAALDDDLSAFSVLSPTNQTLTQWIDVNSDKMRRGQRHLVAQGGDHVVKLGEEVQWACDHEAALCAGYSAIYGIISQNRHALLQEASLNTLACQSMRFIFRNSSLYAKLHQRIQSPVCMMDGVYVSFELEKLARAFLSHDSCPNEWPIFAFERLGMMRGDIPDFHSSPRSSDLWFDSQMVVEAYFDQPAFDYAAERIRAASDTDKAQQLRFISLSLRTQAFVRQKMQYSHNRVLLTGATGKMESSQVSMDERLMRALEIGDLITHLALTQADGSVSWLGVVPDEARQAAQFAEVDDGLYEGRIGIALFLAALTAISGRAHYADLVVDRVVPSLQDRLHSSSNGGSSPQPIEIGLANGKAGIAYGLLTIATLTQRPDLLKYAVEWGQSIDSASISQTSSSDMLLGQAGVITTLLLLHEKTGHETLLKAAVHGGEQLLAQQVMTAAGMLGWPDAQGQCLTGFSHGAAGIVYALLCLADTSGDPRFFAAAGEGLAYESSLYAAAYGNWPDLRGGTLSYDGNDAWCHGAPGIGLGRLYSLPYYDSAQVRLDIARSAEFLRAQPLGRIDHLCCGNWGRLDIAHTLARALPELGLADAVQAQTQALLARSAGIGNHRISADFAPIYRLGLFQGLAGIGYALLRLLQPELPCILAFQ